MRVVLPICIGVLIVAGVAARLSVPGGAAPPSPLIDRSLQAIACPSLDRCIAVGVAGSADTVRVPLTAVLEQGGWTPGSPPAVRLGDRTPSAVACSSNISCVAVGSQEITAPFFGAPSGGDRPFIQAWDGRTWRQLAAVEPAGTTDAELNGVACASTICIAVGQFQKRFQGPDHALAEVWNGRSWTLENPPSLPAENEASLSDVACTSPRSCIAVGRISLDIGPVNSNPFIERWDGARWRFTAAVNPGSAQAALNAVSCPSRTRCIAVGSTNARRGVVPLAEMSDGRRWRALRTAEPPRPARATLVDVSCPAPDRCTAVGYAVSAGVSRPLIETWNGRRWRIDHIAVPAGFAASVLQSIDCPSSAACWAIGQYQHTGPATLHSFSAALRDGRWVARRIPKT